MARTSLVVRLPKAASTAKPLTGGHGRPHPRGLNRQRVIPILFAATGLACLAAFVFMARLDWTGDPPQWDFVIAAWVQSWSFPGITVFMVAISWFGWSPQSWIIVAAICLLLYIRGLRLAAPLAILSGVSHLAVRWLKESAHRLRPELGLLPNGPIDPSFPSGHATQYTIFLGLVAYLSLRRMHSGWGRRAVIAVCLVLVVLVGPSRVYLGQHWPSDVLAGYLLGAGLVLMIIAVSEWRRVASATRSPSHRLAR
jgi:undecaprenyl-diphosphatase